MAGYGFSLDPVSVPLQETAYRRICTGIPAPGTRAVFEALDRYESRSMHGQLPVVWDRAQGFQVWDQHGNCWIDFTSTIFVTNAGHSHPAVVKRMQKVLSGDLLHSYTYATDIRVEYLEKLIAATPASLEKAFLLSAGTETTDCAFKIMRLNSQKQGKRRPGIVSFLGAMHGRTLAAVMMGGTPAARSWIGYDDPDVHQLPFPCPWMDEGMTGAERAQRDLARLSDEKGLDPAQDLCGIILESYQGWGAILYPADYVQEVARFAKEHNLVLCFDEIQSGFGRTGKLFCYEHYDVEPDLVCCGKGLGSGVPLAALLGRAELMDLPDVGSMSSTHSANPLVCAAGLGTLEALEQDQLVAESARKGALLHEKLGELQQRWPDRIKWVLGAGMVAALLIHDPETGAPDGESATRICVSCLQKGLILVHTGRESIKIGPPLNIPDDALVEGVAVLSEAMDEIFGGNM